MDHSSQATITRFTVPDGQCKSMKEALYCLIKELCQLTFIDIVKIPLALIICHVVSTITGFVPEQKRIFRLIQTKDYYKELIADTIKGWYLNRHINYLEKVNKFYNYQEVSLINW